MTQPNKINRLLDIIARSGLSKATIYRLEAQGKFPARVRLGERAVGWKESDFQAWLDSRETV